MKPNGAACGGGVCGPRFDRERVGRDCRYVGVPEVATHVLTVREAWGREAAWQAAAGGVVLGGVPPHEAGSQEEDVAGRELDARVPACELKVIGRDLDAARRVVGPSRRFERPRDVQDDGASDDSATCPVVDGVASLAADRLGSGSVVVHVAAVADVRQRVPLATRLREDVVPHVVEADAARLVDDVVPGQTTCGVERRIEEAQRRIERERRSAEYELGGTSAHLRCQQVEQSDLVVVAEQVPPQPPSKISWGQFVVRRQLHAAPPGCRTTRRTASTSLRLCTDRRRSASQEERVTGPEVHGVLEVVLIGDVDLEVAVEDDVHGVGGRG